MNSKIRILVSCLALICNLRALDLYQSYQHALSYNADYLQAIAQNQAGQELPTIARAALLPQVGAQVSLSENYFDQGGIQATFHQPVYAANLSQVVFDFSKFSAYTKAKFARDLSDLQLANAQQQLMVKVAQAYFNVLLAEDTLQATQMTKQALAKQLTQAKAAFTTGNVTIADVNDAQAAYDAAQAQELQDTNSLISQKNIFQNLTGANPEQIQPLASNINLVTPVPTSDQEWAKVALGMNLNNQIAAKQLAMAREDIAIARSGHYPTLTFNAQYQYQDTGGIDATNASPQQMAMLTIPGSPLSNYTVGSAFMQLSIPLFAGGGVNAKTRQAMANYESAAQQQLSVNRGADQNIRNAFWQVQNGVSLVKAQKAALLSAKTKLDSDQLGYQVGVRNSVDLVNAQKNYYQTYQTYQQARYQYLLAAIQLRYLSGQITPKYLQEINANIQN